MTLTRTFLILTLLFLITINLSSQKVGINVTKPDFTLDVRPALPTNSAVLNLSDPTGSEYFQLIGPNSTDLNSGLLWKKGNTLDFALWDTVDKIPKDFIKLDGRRIGVYNTGQSIFIGDGAGNADDLISNHNVGVGNLSMNLNVSGVSNVGVGSGSLRNNNGNDNVGIGRNAGLNNASGNFNVALGHSAMLNNQSGSRNTLLGTHAGQGSSGISYSGNVFIGYDAGRNEANSNRLYIDNTNTTNPLVYGEFDNNMLRVNGDAEVTGNLNLGEGSNNPKAGDVRFNAEKKDFEGYDGEQWLSLTKGNQLEWGYATGLRVEKQAALPSDGQDNDEFGFSVDISGDYAIVGAPSAGNGKAYIFHYVDQCWVEEAILTDPNGQVGDKFGYSVAISGDYAIVGAPFSDYDNGTNSGRALFFERSGLTWALKASEEPNLPRSGDNFGFSISMDGDYAVIGVPGDHVTVSDQGSAYIMFNINGDWSSPSSVVVVAPDPTPPSGDGLFPDAFGTSVAISGDNVIVGAPGHDDVIPNTTTLRETAGKIYLFERGANWTQWSIEPNNIEQNYAWDYTGQNVSILNNQLSFSYNDAGSSRIRIIDGDGPNGWLTTSFQQLVTGNFVNLSSDGDYVMKGNIIYQKINDSWQVNARLTTNDYFGNVTSYATSDYAVAISGGKIVLGNPDFSAGSNSGKVYFYHR